MRKEKAMGDEREKEAGKKVRIAGRAALALLGLIEVLSGSFYMLVSVACISYGYHHYLLNRSAAVLFWCFLAVVLLLLLMGATLLHKGFGEAEFKLPVRKAVKKYGWFLGVVLVVWLGNVFSYIKDGSTLYTCMALFLLLLLVCLSVYVFFIVFRKGKKGWLYFPVMLVWEIFCFWLDKTLLSKAETGPLAPLTFLVLLTASFTAAFFLRLIFQMGDKKRDLSKKQALFRRAGMLVPGLLIFLNFMLAVPDEFFSPSLKQDGEGYYLLCSREGFQWFIEKVQSGSKDISARLTEDLVLNDTSDWEHWEESPPENSYGCMVHYNGHFDGNGHGIEGYYSKYEMPVFCVLEEQALVTDLAVGNSLFYTTYEESSYLDDDGEVNVVSASTLCFANYGSIKNCDVETKVLGAWSAGGIVAINYGEMENCCFSGNVEAGRDFCEDRGGERWAVETLYTGGICRSCQGKVWNCRNEGTISAKAITDTYYMNYAVGGIAGTVSEDGSMEGCENQGRIESPQLCGGIAGANQGKISQCINSGEVCVEQAGLDYVQSLITAGICASNGGVVDSCCNKGNVSIWQDSLSFYAPIYGIACNLVNPKEGRTENCYYLVDCAQQDYRQAGVYKLSETEMADREKDLTGGQRIQDVDTWELLPSMPDYPGTDEKDYIHLHMGPEKDTAYQVLSGDTLWGIAEAFYGDGFCYSSLKRQGDSSNEDMIFPGEELTVPCLDYYLLCANGEEGFEWSFCRLSSGEPCPTRYFAAKPSDWYYGSMDFAAGKGLRVLWPKDKELGHDAAAGDIRILYYMDGNPEGDFFASDWEGVKENIRKSAQLYCGQAVDGLRFYRYELDGGEFLYGYSFRLNSPQASEYMPLDCAVFYRLREGFLAEFIGIEPAGEDMHVLERVRYLAARIVDGPAVGEIAYTGEEFYGREGWEYTRLHNPFATALEYSPQAECSSVMLFTGAQ